MFAVSPVAPVSVADLSPQRIDAPERVASVIASMVPTHVALDPRAGFALSTQAADAVLALARVNVVASQTVAPSMPQAGTAQRADAAAQPIVAGHAQAEGNASGNAASETGAQAGGAGHTISADFDRTAVEVQTARRIDEALKWDAYLYNSAPADSGAMNATGVYLLCNNVHYEDFKSDHPDIDIKWINIDNKNIVSVWPKITEPWFATP